MHGIPKRVVPMVAAAATVVAVVPAAAQANRHQVTGTQTTITPSAQVIQFLSAHHVTVTATAPAMIANGSVTLPISGGFVSHRGQRGVLRHQGGIEFSDGSRSLALGDFVLIGAAHRVRLLARTSARPIVIARLVDVTRTVSGKSGTISGELTLSGAAARRIDHRFGQQLVSAGDDLGQLTSSVTVA